MPKQIDTRIPLPLYTGGYLGDSAVLSSYMCVNLYPERIIGEPENQVALIGAPGFSLAKANVSSGKYRVNGSAVHEDLAYFVIDNQLVSVNTSLTVSVKTPTLNTSDGSVSMSSNGVVGGQLTILDGTDGWVWDGSTLSQITDVDFPASPTRTTFIDGYTVVLEADSDFFYLSDFYDSTAYSSTQKARAERNPDGLVQCTAYKRQLWLLGENTTEVWYNSGNVVPFDPVPNIFIQYGIHAADSLVNFDEGGLVWMAQDTNGETTMLHVTDYTPKEIISPQIHEQWRSYTDKAQAYAFGYRLNGHLFYQITFPISEKTWVCDLSTNYAWHELREGQNKRHPAAVYLYFNNSHYFGDYRNGNLYEMSPSTYTFNTDEIIREFTTYHISNTGEKIRHLGLELEMETGVGLLSGQGITPKIWMQYSDNGGRTFGNKRYINFGIAGDYHIRAPRWPLLGSSRNRVYKIGMSDPVKIRINRALLDTRITKN